MLKAFWLRNVEDGASAASYTETITVPSANDSYTAFAERAASPVEPVVAPVEPVAPVVEPVAPVAQGMTAEQVSQIVSAALSQQKANDTPTPQERTFSDDIRENFATYAHVVREMPVMTITQEDFGSDPDRPDLSRLNEKLTLMMNQAQVRGTHKALEMLMPVVDNLKDIVPTVNSYRTSAAQNEAANAVSDFAEQTLPGYASDESVRKGLHEFLNTTVSNVYGENWEDAYTSNRTGFIAVAKTLITAYNGNKTNISYTQTQMPPAVVAPQVPSAPRDLEGRFAPNATNPPGTVTVTLEQLLGRRSGGKY